MKRVLVIALTVAGLASGPHAPAQSGRAHEAAFERFKESVVTVEVLPLAGEAKSGLGSGWLAAPGRIVTNYHVVGSYIRHPARYGLRVKDGRATVPAKLLAFDLINDLALLEAAVPGAPFRLAPNSGQPGAPVIAFGNPEGLGKSLIEGVFNGYASKGFIDRMLLSMPLNPGMSGGPILSARNEVVGTNVSISWRANSLSFGVPVDTVRALLEAPPVDATERGLFAEVNRQLSLLERRARERAVQPLLDAKEPPMTVGGVSVPRLPEAFECWNQAGPEARDQVVKTSIGCNLQFTPSLEEVGEVASVEVLVEHYASRANGYGFYGGLTQRGPMGVGIDSRAPGNGVISPPECRTDRLRTDQIVFSVNACSYAYVHHPGLGYFVLSAMSVSRPREAVYVVLHGRGVSGAAFSSLSRALLAGLRFVGPS